MLFHRIVCTSEMMLVLALYRCECKHFFSLLLNFGKEQRLSDLYYQILISQKYINLEAAYFTILNCWIFSYFLPFFDEYLDRS